MDSRTQHSELRNADGIQSAFTELTAMPDQSDGGGEELAIKQRIWEKVCERLNELEREKTFICKVQRGKNGT
jgi:hypothetical protein